MPRLTTADIQNIMREERAAAEVAFQTIGRPGTSVHNLSNANRTNSGSLNRDLVEETFARTVGRSIDRARKAIDLLTKPANQ